jgi:ATP/ADP translocase
MPVLHACTATPVQVAGLDSKAVFYWALAPMVAFYAFFAAVLLPNADVIQPVALATKYCATLVS